MFNIDLSNIKALREAARSAANNTLTNIEKCRPNLTHKWINVSFNFIVEECVHCGLSKETYRKEKRNAAKQLKNSGG